MKACRVIWEDFDELVMLTERFEKVKKRFRETLPEDNSVSVWCILYDDKRYDVWPTMDGSVDIYDKREDEVVSERWDIKREGLATMPLDTKEFLELNPNYSSL